MSVIVPFFLATLGGIAFAVCYGLDLGSEALGGSFGGAFAMLAIGLAVWSKKMEHIEPVYVEERDIGPSGEEEWSSFRTALTEEVVPRSRVLWGMLAVAASSIGVAALFPLRSMLPREGASPSVLYHTKMRRGLGLIDAEGRRIKASDLDVGGVVTAYPAGVVPDFVDKAEYNADAATLLIKVNPLHLQLPPKRMRWVVDGVVAYSKLCTHAGCPVGLYADSHTELLCPCHHSIFDVLRGAEPIEGPAARPLPQLPMGTDDEGYLIALGDFTAPTGAGWWGFPHNLGGGG
jgi:ubiquinol-cytochrome c reductase iron-sulfur subunit